MKKIVILVILVFAVLPIGFCHAASITKDTQSEFTISGSSFNLTTATKQPGDVILTLTNNYGLVWDEDKLVASDLFNPGVQRRMIADGSNGAIFTWEEFGVGINVDIYAQKIDQTGQVVWTNTAICTESTYQRFPELVTDGAGGAIIAWTDGRDNDFDIYAQKIDANGNLKWAQDGIMIAGGSDRQVEAKLVPDGSGGAIVVYEDGLPDVQSNDTDSWDIVAKRIDSSGNTVWTKDICVQRFDQAQIAVIKDASNNVFIAWEDKRNDDIRLDPFDKHTDIYAQKIDLNGNIKWAANGVSVCSKGEKQRYVSIISNGSGGLIAAWLDYRFGNPEIFVQNIDSNGARIWALDGIEAYSGSAVLNDHDEAPQIVSDTDGGVVLVWEDERNGVNSRDIYAQRVDSQGNFQWGGNDKEIFNVSANQERPQIISDGADGAIIAWSGQGFIYAQRIKKDGTVLWTQNGEVITDYPNPLSPVLKGLAQVVPDNNNGAVVGWLDARNGTIDIFAQRIAYKYNSSGTYTSEKIENSDSDFSGWSIFNWTGTGTISAQIKTAATESALDSTAWQSITSGSDIPNKDNGNYKWLQFKMTLNASNSNATTPVLQSLSLNYNQIPSSSDLIINPIAGPSPFNPAAESANITYFLNENLSDGVKVYIYNINGELIWRNNINYPGEGTHIGYNKIAWDGRDSFGNTVDNGVYIYFISAKDKFKRGKLIILKK